MDEVVNAIRGLSEEVKDAMIVKKVLRSLLSSYALKVFSIEEAKDLDKFNMDELFGSLSAYGMRIGKGDTSKREAAFKAVEVEYFEIDHEEVNFVRKLKRGSGKYKGKLPFKCF